MRRIYCMIIGDIVRSQNIDPTERAKLQKKLQLCLDEINYKYVKSICSNFSITLGDEFQGGLYNPISLFEIITMIQKSIDPYKMRFGIGIDTLNTHIKYSDSLSTDGPAYHKARRAVEELKDIETYEYGIRIYSFKNDHIVVNSLLRTLDTISSDWTEKQKEYIHSIYNDETAAGLASRKGVSVSTVSRTLHRANYKIISESTRNIEQYLYEAYFISEEQDTFLQKYNRTAYLLMNKLYDEALMYILSSNPVIDIDRLNKNFMLADIYNDMGFYDRSINYANAALNYITPDYRAMEIQLMNLLGINYYEIKDMQRALEYYNKALELLQLEKTYDKKIYIEIKSNIAIVHSENNEFNAAKNIFKELYNYLMVNYPDDEVSKIQTLLNIAHIYYKEGNYSEGVRFCEIAEENADKYLQKDNVLKAFLYEVQADIKTKLIKTSNDTSDALRTVFNLYKHSEEIFKKNSRYSDVLRVCESIYNLYVDYSEIITGEEYTNKLTQLNNNITKLRKALGG